jgi:ubiquinone/menaquinone biosynthesis C-methylase UbiE
MDIEKSNSRSIVGINKRDWDKMEIRHMHADTTLIRWQKKFFPQGTGRKLLDLGFGEGQNSIYLLSQGFECSGTEIAKSRLRFLQSQLRTIRKEADLRLVDSNALPFPDSYFDIVVAWESLYYNNSEGIREAIGEVCRVLKPGGQFLSSLISPKHKLCANARRIAPSTFRPAQKSQKACIIYAPGTKRQIKKLYWQFTNVTIGFQSSLISGPSDYDYHHIIYCQKGL